jgi:hypothetical protein
LAGEDVQTGSGARAGPPQEEGGAHWEPAAAGGMLERGRGRGRRRRGGGRRVEHDGPRERMEMRPFGLYGPENSSPHKISSPKLARQIIS